MPWVLGVDHLALQQHLEGAAQLLRIGSPGAGRRRLVAVDDGAEPLKHRVRRFKQEIRAVQPAVGDPLGQPRDGIAGAELRVEQHLDLAQALEHDEVVDARDHDLRPAQGHGLAEPGLHEGAHALRRHGGAPPELRLGGREGVNHGIVVDVGQGLHVDRGLARPRRLQMRVPDGRPQQRDVGRHLGGDLRPADGAQHRGDTLDPARIRAVHDVQGGARSGAPGAPPRRRRRRGGCRAPRTPTGSGRDRPGPPAGAVSRSALRPSRIRPSASARTVRASRSARPASRTTLARKRNGLKRVCSVR